MSRPFAALIVLCLTSSFAAAQGPVLNMVAVGINQYRTPGMNLRYAVSDARDVAASLNNNRMFVRKDINILVDSQATVANLMAGLDLLARRASANTYSVLYLSGHGTRDAKGHFLYPSYDYNPQRAAATSISGDVLQYRLRRMPGKVILIIDACHSGSAGLKTDWVPPANSNQTIIISSSLSRETSLEMSHLKNGAFTQAFVEAMNGAGDQNKNRIVSLQEVHNYVYTRVVQLTGGKQHVKTFVPTVAHGAITMATLSTTPAAGAVVWTGRETLAGFGALSFSLYTGGRVVMNDAKGQFTGTWTTNGSTVTLRFANGKIVYTGHMTGTTFAGMAQNVSQRWTFSLTRR